ncbi:pyruvate kinase cytosolic isozyme [Phtheirospermum japonicum]|uniref:Pyruvate kinase cytosolic isozyme n=1 Tax=Phtheirospermum japonicum TaxID=374723 RepID=A0A830CPV6_9LAMI|nr:pyruvate kinase cytosolic isozyme [Phtheirospermum japonicum]
MASMSKVERKLFLQKLYLAMVNCYVKVDLGLACNYAGMIDRYILGVDNLYAKPMYRNLKECNISSHGQVPEASTSWYYTPFDPRPVTSSGRAARLIAKYRPTMHVLSVVILRLKTNQLKWSFSGAFEARQSLIVRGLFPLLVDPHLNKNGKTPAGVPPAKLDCHMGIQFIKYTAPFNAETVKNFLYALNNGKISKKKFNYDYEFLTRQNHAVRLAPEEASAKLTGYEERVTDALSISVL